MPTPRKSLAQHQLQGTKPHYPVDEGKPVHVGGRPRYPKGISRAARCKFKALCRELESRRTLTPGDGEALRLYAIAYDIHEQAVQKLNEEGSVRTYTRIDANGVAHEIEKANLWQGIFERQTKIMVGILQHLGLTPASRLKAPLTKTGADEDIVPGSIRDTHPELFQPGPRVVPMPAPMPPPTNLDEIGDADATD